MIKWGKVVQNVAPKIMPVVAAFVKASVGGSSQSANASALLNSHSTGTNPFLYTSSYINNIPKIQGYPPLAFNKLTENIHAINALSMGSSNTEPNDICSTVSQLVKNIDDKYLSVWYNQPYPHLSLTSNCKDNCSDPRILGSSAPIDVLRLVRKI